MPNLTYEISETPLNKIKMKKECGKKRLNKKQKKKKSR